MSRSAGIIMSTKVGLQASVPSADTRFLTNWDDNRLTDKARGLEFGVRGSPSVSGGVATLVSGDGWYARRISLDFSFILTGEPWTIEFFASRSSTSEGTILATSESTSATRGVFVSVFSDGRVKLLIGRGVSGTPIVDYTWPAGTVPATGRHHIVLENSGHISESATGSVFWLAVNGARVSGVAATNRMSTQGEPYERLTIGQTPSGARSFAGTLGSIKIRRGVQYDIKTNASFTVPTQPLAPSETRTFKSFGGRQVHRINDNPFGAYSAEMKTAHIGDGHVFATFQNNDGHSGYPGNLYATRSFDFGRNWTGATLIGPALSANEEHRGAILTRTSTGRLIAIFHFRNYSTNTLLMYKIHSDDNGLNWSSPENMTSKFSTSMQANGSGPHCYGRMVETSNGLALCAYANPVFSASTTQLEVLFSADDGDTWGSPVTIEVGTTRANLLNETQLVCCNDPLKVVAISRSEDVGDENIYFAFKSSDGGSTWTYYGSAAWPMTSVTAPGPPEVYETSDGRILMAFTERGGINCFYTVTDAAAFFLNPLRAFNGTETKVQYHQKDNSYGPTEYGYQQALELSAGNFIFTHYEGFQNTGNKARLIVTGVSGI